MSTVENHKIVSRDQWLAARIELLANEKELTRARDAVSSQRRQLPWVKVEKECVFDTPSGKKTLAELFNGNSQLILLRTIKGEEPDAEDHAVPVVRCAGRRGNEFLHLDF